ncbi:hypothetical protein GALMADRAFT_147363 [Galerina marginata CBS 339.88]|uniref:Uncharacterized protein n=1 Tax=Galerina marginata (strain CBS 339.88) TaxID=685588 RepID=A0A067S8K2_GALM3|nr:hypothetical protein GALMADRAFT_147363 [Galerina marginata CBS 339.88]
MPSDVSKNASEAFQTLITDRRLAGPRLPANRVRLGNDRVTDQRRFAIVDFVLNHHHSRPFASPLPVPTPKALKIKDLHISLGHGFDDACPFPRRGIATSSPRAFTTDHATRKRKANANAVTNIRDDVRVNGVHQPPAVPLPHPPMNVSQLVVRITREPRYRVNDDFDETSRAPYRTASTSTGAVAVPSVARPTNPLVLPTPCEPTRRLLTLAGWGEHGRQSSDGRQRSRPPPAPTTVSTAPTSTSPPSIVTPDDADESP